MPEDMSLDAFAGDTDASADDADEAGADTAPDDGVTATGTDDTGEDGGDESGSAGGANDVEPAQSTYDWSPDGAACAACGETVARRWRDGGEMVCADCKEW